MESIWYLLFLILAIMAEFLFLTMMFTAMKKLVDLPDRHPDMRRCIFDTSLTTLTVILWAGLITAM